MVLFVAVGEISFKFHAFDLVLLITALTKVKVVTVLTFIPQIFYLVDIAPPALH